LSRVLRVLDGASTLPASFLSRPIDDSAPFQSCLKRVVDRPGDRRPRGDSQRDALQSDPRADVASAEAALSE
jgi:hypothetical protein